MVTQSRVLKQKLEGAGENSPYFSYAKALKKEAFKKEHDEIFALLAIQEQLPISEKNRIYLFYMVLHSLDCQFLEDKGLIKTASKTIENNIRNDLYILENLLHGNPNLIENCFYPQDDKEKKIKKVLEILLQSHPYEEIVLTRLYKRLDLITNPETRRIVLIARNMLLENHGSIFYGDEQKLMAALTAFDQPQDSTSYYESRETSQLIELFKQAKEIGSDGKISYKNLIYSQGDYKDGHYYTSLSTTQKDDGKTVYSFTRQSPQKDLETISKDKQNYILKLICQPSPLDKIAILKMEGLAKKSNNQSLKSIITAAIKERQDFLNSFEAKCIELIKNPSNHDNLAFLEQWQKMMIAETPGNSVISADLFAEKMMATMKKYPNILNTINNPSFSMEKIENFQKTLSDKLTAELQRKAAKSEDYLKNIHDKPTDKNAKVETVTDSSTWGTGVAASQYLVFHTAISAIHATFHPPVGPLRKAWNAFKAIPELLFSAISRWFPSNNAHEIPPSPIPNRSSVLQPMGRSSLITPLLTPDDHVAANEFHTHTANTNNQDNSSSGSERSSITIK